MSNSVPLHGPHPVHPAVSNLNLGLGRGNSSQRPCEDSAGSTVSTPAPLWVTRNTAGDTEVQRGAVSGTEGALLPVEGCLGWT